MWFLIVCLNKHAVSGSQVFDGSKTGFDLNYLADTSKVSANWQGFGDKTAVSDMADSNLQAGK